MELNASKIEAIKAPIKPTPLKKPGTPPMKTKPNTKVLI
jgi:hypothetical protein